MRSWQEGVQLSALPVEGKGMSTKLSLHRLHPAHPVCVDHVDDTGIAYRNV
jgi:hypothetical protein